MAMGTRAGEQSPLWVATSDLPKSPGHPFYARLNAVLDAHHFDRFVEQRCQRFDASVMGRPSLPPARYFRLLLLGYFEAQLLTGKTIGIDATTLEANAAMRSIVRRDTGESYQAFLTGLAKTSGIDTPTREDLARLDRTRTKKTSNKEWTNPIDPD